MLLEEKIDKTLSEENNPQPAIHQKASTVPHSKFPHYRKLNLKEHEIKFSQSLTI